MDETAETAAVEPAPPPDADAERAAKFDAIVRAWAVERLYNSPLSRQSDAMAHVLASLPALITALTQKG